MQRELGPSWGQGGHDFTSLLEQSLLSSKELSLILYSHIVFGIAPKMNTSLLHVQPPYTFQFSCILRLAAWGYKLHPQPPNHI